ncbi:hypothetical protein [Isoptericola dokdonensis]|uniref:Uncharacterized protein n=1 Tax=Isoptericola dokdonensis DS-3 TaxID=1300344 RepID=A0A161IE83_9MICO|nr:hypothetical protein [Isoptericola dokdonensis]ANC32091.1 hypothetical protein I598_2557 [Isoptericola dokdonensis DS-3]
MSDGLRVDGDGVAGVTAGLRALAAAWSPSRGATDIAGVGSGVADTADEAAARWSTELTTAGDGLQDLADVVDAAVAEVAATDAGLARAAQGGRRQEAV